jgi:predicted RNA-binding protein with RPS1 domain
MVKVLDIDDKGRINLSRKEALPHDPARQDEHSDKDVDGNRRRGQRANRRSKKEHRPV